MKLPTEVLIKMSYLQSKIRFHEYFSSALFNEKYFSFAQSNKCFFIKFFHGLNKISLYSYLMYALKNMLNFYLKKWFYLLDNFFDFQQNSIINNLVLAVDFTSAYSIFIINNEHVHRLLRPFEIFSTHLCKI